MLDALIAHGHISSFIGADPTNRCPQKLGAAEEIERFQTKYVSLWALSRQRGLHIAAMKARLEAAGFETAFDQKKIGARFYRTAVSPTRLRCHLWPPMRASPPARRSSATSATPP